MISNYFMKSCISFEKCLRLVCDRYITHYQGSDNTFTKYFVLCTCLTPGVLAELSLFDNLYISSYNNYPTIVIRCKNA